jgi:hypothetical protein
MPKTNSSLNVNVEYFPLLKCLRVVCVAWVHLRCQKVDLVDDVGSYAANTNNETQQLF